jgi:cysteine desulfurase
MSVYLDYNATAPLRPEVIAKFSEMLAVPANPSSVHSYGRAAKKYLEDARKIIAEAIGAFTSEVIFMGCGTEANMAALHGFSIRRVLVSAVEHSSVLKHGDDIIPVDSNGIINLSALDKMLAGGDPALVSIMLANNETGAIQPIREAAGICKKHDALLHCDAVQGLGKIPVDFTALGCDLMTIAAHKMGGPVGAAALVVRQDLPVAPLLIGGGQEMNRRAGTENVAAIAGFARAVELIDLAHMQKLRVWLDDMERHVFASVFSKEVNRLPNTTCLAVSGITQEVMIMKLDLSGFAVSAGSACSSGRIEASHVLTAMGVDKVLAGSAIRISGGWNTTREDIDKLSAYLRLPDKTAK